MLRSGYKKCQAYHTFNKRSEENITILSRAILGSYKSHIVEEVTKLKTHAQRKKATLYEPNAKKGRKEKEVKDPNIPKSAPTALFLFMSIGDCIR